MGLAVIPTDWTTGYTEVCISWPDSPEWLAVLRGLLTSPVEPIFWDAFTGDPEEPATALYPTFDQNLHPEVCMHFITGMIMMWPLEAPPSGWLAFNGQFVLKADYPDLWTFLGDLFGESELEFQVGPVAGAVPIGFDEGSTYADPINNYGGEATHTLTTAELASHNHTQNSHNHTQDAHNHTQNSHNHTQDAHNHTQNAHTHSVTGNLYTSQAVTTFTSGVGTQTLNAVAAPSATATNQATTPTNQSTTPTNQATTPTNQSTTPTNQTTGSGTPHNNLPPFFVTQFIIKT